MTLTLGYKASAEQFSPRELVEIAVSAETHGFDSVAASDHFQPWRHEGGHAPFSLAWMAAVGERTSTHPHRHQRDDPDLPLQPGGHRPGLRHARLPLPRPRHARRRHAARRSTRSPPVSAAPASRTGPSSRSASRGCASRSTSCASSGPATGSTSRASTTRPHDASIYDRPEGGIPVYIAAGGPVVAKYAGRAGDGFICTSGKGMELYTEQLLPAVRGGRRGGRARLRRHRQDDRDQAQLRGGRADRARQHAASGRRSR